MVEFHLGIDHERWQQFTEACNTQAGKELSPAEVERKAFDIWCNSIDAVIKYHRTQEDEQSVLLQPDSIALVEVSKEADIIMQNVDPAVRNAYEEEMVNPSPRRTMSDDGPAIII
jgi:hypothetical protein